MPLGKPQSQAQGSRSLLGRAQIKPKSPCPARVTLYSRKSHMEGQGREKHICGLPEVATAPVTDAEAVCSRASQRGHAVQ